MEPVFTFPLRVYYIQGMETHYQTLRTLYEIVKQDTQPERYWCAPREIIVRQVLAWDQVESHLKQLADEAFIEGCYLGAYMVRITHAGMEKARSLSVIAA